MEYREDPEKKKEENQDVGEEEFSFIQETIKDENGGYRKVRAAVLRCAGLGLLFGLAASLGFCALNRGRRSSSPAVRRRSPSRRRKRRRRRRTRRKSLRSRPLS